MSLSMSPNGRNGSLSYLRNDDGSSVPVVGGEDRSDL